MSTENQAASQSQIIADVVAKRLERQLEGVQNVARNIATASAKIADSLAAEVLAESVARRLLGESVRGPEVFSRGPEALLEDAVRNVEFFANRLRDELELAGLLQSKDAEFVSETPRQE